MDHSVSKKKDLVGREAECEVESMQQIFSYLAPSRYSFP